MRFVFATTMFLSFLVLGFFYGGYSVKAMQRKALKTEKTLTEDQKENAIIGGIVIGFFFGLISLMIFAASQIWG